jgi:alkylation response protein AidB-like acyl-CoA dehydrogenase
MRSGALLPPARPLPAATGELRAEVRAFLAGERQAGRFVPACDAWLSGWDEGFSRRLAARGWVGMTVPPEYGGPGRSALERYVVVEEVLAAGAPVAAHWVSDRQIVPNLLRYGNETLKRRYLPSIARGECYFAIGLSEPDAGSDLAGCPARRCGPAAPTARGRSSPCCGPGRRTGGSGMSASASC